MPWTAVFIAIFLVALGAFLVVKYTGAINTLEAWINSISIIGCGGCTQ